MPLLFLSLVLALSLEPAPQAGTQRGTISAPSLDTRPVARVSGSVVEDGTNLPVSGARVVVIGQDRPPVASSAPVPPPETITDDNGHYVFEGLPPGRYRIGAQREGFAVQPAPDPSAFRTFEVAAGQTLSGVNISLQQAGAIAGQILDPFSGEPVAGSMVAAMRRTTIPPLGTPRLMPAAESTRTNDLGEFRISGLPPGEYLIVASRPPNYGFATSSTFPGGAATTAAAAPPTLIVMTFYPGTADSSAAQTVAVGAGQVATGIVIRLLMAQTYQVSGTVVDERGAPVAGAIVNLRFDPRTSALAGGLAGQGRSDASGKFVIGGVMSGPYGLTASLPVTTSGQEVSRGGVRSTMIMLSPVNRSNQLDLTVTDVNAEGVQVVVQR